MIVPGAGFARLAKRSATAYCVSTFQIWKSEPAYRWVIRPFNLFRLLTSFRSESGSATSASADAEAGVTSKISVAKKLILHEPSVSWKSLCPASMNS